MNPDQTLTTLFNKFRSRAVLQIPHYVPIVGWLPRYPREHLQTDLISGITVWGVSVPTALAYAGLAGVPPQAGLYTMMAAMLLFAIFSTTRELKVTASSTMAIMSAAVVAPMAAGNAAQFWVLTSQLALIVGIMLLLAGIVRLGFIADFLAKPVVTGFVFGLAIVIAVGQLPKILGIPSVDGNVFQQIVGIVRELDQVNYYTLAIGGSAIALIFILRRKVPAVPPGLVALALGILIAAVFQISQYDVSLVGEIPTGLPEFGISGFNLFDLPALLVGAFGIVFLAVGESLGSARAFATKNHYNINPDQELIAMGMVNLGTGMAQGMTADASLSISATSDASGARSQLGGLVAAALALVTILFLAPLFSGLPNAVLGAIVISSVIGLMDVPELRRYYHARRTDFALALVALFGVVLSSVLVGLMLAVFLSLLFVLYRASRAYIAILGRVPGHVAAYGDISRHPEYQQLQGLIIFRPDAPLFFANTSVADKEIRQNIAKQETPPKAIVVDLGATNDLDVASADMLHDLVSELRDNNIETLFAQVRGGVRDRMRKTGLMSFVGEQRIFFSVEGAVSDFIKRNPAPPPDANPVTVDDDSKRQDEPAQDKSQNGTAF